MSKEHARAYRSSSVSAVHVVVGSGFGDDVDSEDGTEGGQAHVELAADGFWSLRGTNLHAVDAGSDFYGVGIVANRVAAG